MGTIEAASPSYADVNAAVTAAVNGDTVVVPSGSATWSSRLSITKAITLKAGGVYAVNGGRADIGSWPTEITFSGGGIWGNPRTVVDTNAARQDAGTVTYVVQGRDYETSDDDSAALGGYMAYTYPHPLQGGVTPVVVPVMRQNVRLRFG